VEKTTSRRGRPPKGESERRRAAVLDAARAELIEHGYERTTMLGIARRCGASKETLYSWFGGKRELFGEIIAAEGRRAASGAQSLLRDPGADPRAALTGFARALLDLLCGEWSVAVNRAGMSSPELAELVLAHGRHAVGPVVEEVLAELARQGRLEIGDPAAAFRVLYGLVVQDTQIRVLLGERPPSRAARHRQADAAVATFWTIHSRHPARD
jgi:AcrR family transcriptional regulator